MRDLLNNNGKLVTLMGSLFAGIIAVTGAVALFLGDMEYPPLFAASSTSQSTPAPQEPEGPGEDAPPPLPRITPALSTPRLIPMGRSR